MTENKFAYIWQYTVPDAHKDEFLRAYGPDGEWVKLFSKAQGYVETVLLRDAEDSERYVTIDYWESKIARDRFRKKYSAEFATLDEECEAFTQKEEFIGDFEVP